MRVVVVRPRRVRCTFLLHSIVTTYCDTIEPRRREDKIIIIHIVLHRYVIFKFNIFKTGHATPSKIPNLSAFCHCRILNTDLFLTYFLTSSEFNSPALVKHRFHDVQRPYVLRVVNAADGFARPPIRYTHRVVTRPTGRAAKNSKNRATETFRFVRYRVVLNRRHKNNSRAPMT